MTIKEQIEIIIKNAVSDTHEPEVWEGYKLPREYIFIEERLDKAIEKLVKLFEGKETLAKKQKVKQTKISEQVNSKQYVQNK